MSAAQLATIFTAAAAIASAIVTALRQLRHERTYHPPVIQRSTGLDVANPDPPGTVVLGPGEPKWIDPPR